VAQGRQMKVQLEKSFVLPAPADAAWAQLQDLEAVAGSMPGARIVEKIDDRRFKGTVTVRFGPATMAFRGEVQVTEVDAVGRTLRLAGRGTDTTGSSGASMDLVARIEAVDARSCKLLGSSEVSVSGKAAAFGGRMMTTVADQVLGQFAANFGQRLQAAAAPATTAGAPALQTAAPTASAASAASAASEPEPAAPAINGFALAWAMVRDWFHHLFTARRA
jgi:carbon monoxide dehydrogenase subunit G